MLTDFYLGTTSQELDLMSLGPGVRESASPLVQFI